MALPFLPAQHIQSMFVRIEIVMPPNGNMYEVIPTSANRESNIQCLLPTVGQSLSAIISWDHFSMVPFSLLPVPDFVYGIRAIFSVGSSGDPSLYYFKFHC